MAQLARAQTYKPRLSRREMQRLYFYQLFFTEKGGMPLPTQKELWRTLDPQGRQCSNLSAFERDFQRRRRTFDRILTEIDDQKIDADNPEWRDRDLLGTRVDLYEANF
jgi:hypothetical protein